ncbi:MAG: DMT family transporter [Anaerolineales bacterium]|jgi:drug/metabolite transporter (DMT)-like permease
MMMEFSSAQGSSVARGYAIGLLSAAILSTTAIFIRYLSQTYTLPALVLATWRDVFVVVTLAPVLAIVKATYLRIRPKDYLYLMSYGLILALFNALWTTSVALSGAAVGTVLGYSSAAFTTLLGRWLLKEALGWVKLGVVMVSLAGCVLVAGALDLEAWRANTLGVSAGIASGLTYAAYSLMGRSASQRGINPWTTVLYTFGFAALFLLFLNILPLDGIPGKASQPIDLLWLGDDIGGWLLLFALAAGPTVMGFGLYNVSLGYLPSSIANLIVTTEPVFTTTTAYFLLGERLTWLQLLGGLMILGGVVVLRLTEGRRSRRLRQSLL